MKKHVQTETEWQEEITEKIFGQIQSELYLELNFMQIALCAFELCANENFVSMATDGKKLYYSPQRIIDIFKSNGKYLDRAYLHSVLHCLFFHLWTKGKRDDLLWNTACDIMTEYTIDMMDKPCTKRILGYIRTKTYDNLKSEGIAIAPGPIYVWLKKQDSEFLNSLAKEFYTDDHSLWPDEKNEKAMPVSSAQAKKNWEKIARQTQMEKKRRKDESQKGESVMLRQLTARKSRHDYREFLRRFAVLREELHIDADSFDMGYYAYGMAMYGNMPLIEPLETRETYKIRDFVIVLDTSYSVSGELIEKFLKETFSILTETDSFFVKNKIRIIQCDDSIKADEEISDIDHIPQMLSDFTIAGGGGTDFRPAFSYVSELISDGQLKNMCGLLYFTDGKGIYPVKCPPYKCAFIYLDEYDDNVVPAWAITMKIDPEELG
nr:MAG TPA: Putative metallopeptidase domain protein [Caudoviricetes sp.]